ncbi:MAG: DUF1329 domain-containing protein [Gammaproteobacteria bacterium]
MLPLMLFATLAQAADFAFERDQLIEISPRPGTLIEQSNLARYRHVVDADLARLIASGSTTLNVGEPLSFEPHPAFVFATRQQTGRTRIDETSWVLGDFLQGLPFPGVPRPDDAQAGLKTAWNMRYAYTGDSAAIAEMYWQMRDWRSERIEVEMSFAARSMRFTHRHVMPPIPAVERNPQDAYAAFFLEAIDAGGYDDTQVLAFANRDEAREANGWVYLPQLGRTQSLASFSTEESMFGSDILPTDFLVYSGPLAHMRWRYLGSTYLLLPFYRHDRVELAARKARKHDYWHVDFSGRAGCFPRVQWQLRRTLVLEGTARDDAALVRKRVFYVDAQTHTVALWKLYRQNDALWKLALTAFAHPNSHLPHNNETGAPVISAFSTIDIQTNRCTTLQLLSLVNSDDVQAEDFDTARMQSGGGRSFRRR